MTAKTDNSEHPGSRAKKGKARRDAYSLPGGNTARTPAPSEWAPVDLIRACRQESEQSLKVLIGLRDDGEVPAAVRAVAIQMLWDRGYGRAPQMIAVADITPQGQLDVSNLSDEELILLEGLMRKAMGQEPMKVLDNMALHATDAIEIEE